MHDHEEHVVKEEKTDVPQPCCSAGECCPSASDGPKRWKTIVFVLIVIGAGVVLANSLMRNAKLEKPAEGFAAVQMDAGADTPSRSMDTAMTEAPQGTKDQKNAASLSPAELDSLATLNEVATDADAVFVLLTEQNQAGSQAMAGEVEAAAQKIQSTGTQVAVFKLKQTAPEFAQFAQQVSVPCVLALVKGAGMDAVSGEITETRLMQAYVAASRPTSSCCAPGESCPSQE